MKKNLFEDIKISKPFKPFDAIIYLLIIVFIALTFFFFFYLNKPTSNAGFKVLLSGKEILTFQYDNKELNVLETVNYKTENSKGGITITLYIDANSSEYNVLSVNYEERSVKITDANCSNSKDCTFFPPISNDNGSIICLPHKLTVLPINGGYVSPIAGG